MLIADSDLKDLGGNVSNIRRPQNGDFIFELKKSNKAKLIAFVTQLRTHLRRMSQYVLRSMRCIHSIRISMK